MTIKEGSTKIVTCYASFSMIFEMVAGDGILICFREKIFLIVLNKLLFILKCICMQQDHTIFKLQSVNSFMKSQTSLTTQRSCRMKVQQTYAPRGFRPINVHDFAKRSHFSSATVCKKAVRHPQNCLSTIERSAQHQKAAVGILNMAVR